MTASHEGPRTASPRPVLSDSAPGLAGASCGLVIAGPSLAQRLGTGAIPRPSPQHDVRGAGSASPGVQTLPVLEPQRVDPALDGGSGVNSTANRVLSVDAP